MNNKRSVAAIVLAALALCLAAASLFITLKCKAPQEQDVQYVMYLGTNGKDSNKPVFAPEEAKVKAEEILVKHFGGYTVQEAQGGWLDEGTLYREYTLVIYLSDTDIGAVHAAADELITVFDQSSVLIQMNETTTEFYSGAGE